MRFISRIVTAIAIVAVAVPVAAQDWAGSGRIRGTVKTVDGEPIEGATVRFVMAGTESGPEAFVTDRKGKFSGIGLKGGRWVVIVEAQGFYPWNTQTEVFSRGVSDPVNAKLEPIPEEELIALARGQANQYLAAGDELARAGDFAGARAEYEKALAELQEPDQPIVLGPIAATYLNENDIVNAKATYEAALAIDPEHLESIHGMANILAFEGDVEAADAYVKRIPESEAIHPNILITLGMAHFNKGEAEVAKGMLDRAIRDAPDHALSYYYRGLCELSLGDNEAAKADIDRSLELDPNHLQAESAREFAGQLESVPAGG